MKIKKLMKSILLDLILMSLDQNQKQKLGVGVGMDRVDPDCLSNYFAEMLNKPTPNVPRSPVKRPTQTLRFKTSPPQNSEI